MISFVALGRPRFVGALRSKIEGRPFATRPFSFGSELLTKSMRAEVHMEFCCGLLDATLKWATFSTHVSPIFQCGISADFSVYRIRP